MSLFYKPTFFSLCLFTPSILISLILISSPLYASLSSSTISRPQPISPFSLSIFYLPSTSVLSFYPPRIFLSTYIFDIARLPLYNPFALFLFSLPSFSFSVFHFLFTFLPLYASFTQPFLSLTFLFYYPTFFSCASLVSFPLPFLHTLLPHFASYPSVLFYYKYSHYPDLLPSYFAFSFYVTSYLLFLSILFIP